MILTEESVIAFVISLHRRGMRAIAALDYGIHEKSGDHGAIGVASDDLGLNDLFRNHDHPLGGAHCFNHDAKITPAVGVAFRVGALNMNNRQDRKSVV